MFFKLNYINYFDCNMMNKIQTLWLTKRMESIFKDSYYLNSIGVAIKFVSIIVGAWQYEPSNAIAIPQRNTVTPIWKTLASYLTHCRRTAIFHIHICFLGSSTAGCTYFLSLNPTALQCAAQCSRCRGSVHSYNSFFCSTATTLELMKIQSEIIRTTHTEIFLSCGWLHESYNAITGPVWIKSLSW